MKITLLRSSVFFLVLTLSSFSTSFAQTVVIGPTGSGGGGDMTALAYILSGSGVPSNPCSTAGAWYRRTSTTPYTWYGCPSAGGNWVGPFPAPDASGNVTISGTNSDIFWGPIGLTAPSTSGVAHYRYMVPRVANGVIAAHSLVKGVANGQVGPLASDSEGILGVAETAAAISGDIVYVTEFGVTAILCESATELNYLIAGTDPTKVKDSATTTLNGMSAATRFAAKAMSPCSGGLVRANVTGPYRFGARPSFATGTATLGTSPIAANSCASVVTVSASGVLTTDVISPSFNSDVSGVTGYGVASTDGLVVFRYPTADNVNFKVCNGTGSSITPGAATLNWVVVR